MKAGSDSYKGLGEKQVKRVEGPLPSLFWSLLGRRGSRMGNNNSIHHSQSNYSVPGTHHLLSSLTVIKSVLIFPFYRMKKLRLVCVLVI